MTAKYFTKEGLEVKLRQIRSQEAKVKATGREAGDEAGLNCDWHDNFGYEDAKRRLEMESTLLRQLREDVAGAQVITIKEQSESVRIGVTARVRINEEEREVTIGAFGESDVANGLLSYTSPLGRVLLGMKKGESRTARIVNKASEIEVLEVLPPSYLYHRLLKKLISESTEGIQEQDQS